MYSFSIMRRAFFTRGPKAVRRCHNDTLKFVPELNRLSSKIRKRINGQNSLEDILFVAVGPGNRLRSALVLSSLAGSRNTALGAILALKCQVTTAFIYLIAALPIG